MVSWSTIQSALLFFGPMLLPRIIAFYRSLRAPTNATRVPVSPEAARALNLIFASAAVSLIFTLPYFTPNNIFSKTGSRLQTPTPVLFNRLPSSTPQDETLRHIFATGGLEARLQYLRFGPDVLCNCPLVTDPKAQDVGMSYLICAFPSLLKTHLMHLLFLGLATSTRLGGTSAARWRTAAALSGIAVMVADVISVATYEHQRNARATTYSDVENFFWTRYLVSHLAICITDAVIGLLIWASATNRAFVLPPTPALQLEASTKSLETSLAKYKALSAIRNAVMRESGFRGKLNEYWRKEGEIMHELFEEREVLEAVNATLGRLDVDVLTRDAGEYVDQIFRQPESAGL
ncbi:hypothetical protein D6D02_07813 [Aureobasidium pullulans]|uniref:Uncharacterized protein n=1 Tax=Aureobasidium pullulans TaxID=5580 RepID=A0A4S9DTN3_AURPU|nr:hypothetical protein D6D24_04681 [Aureobasidium pullulans]THX24585.1 hypothetical protein D6D10_10099 [Aureobasidium pullulans]THY05073.1 hypothetical protein D6D02_07813 [Aureobasidium pullulans]THZ00735.1 hypothetical protein D6C93_03625 [Aureobasidium pullulans]